MLLFGKPCDYDEDIVATASAAVSLAAPATGNGVRVRGHRRNAVSAPCDLQKKDELHSSTGAKRDAELKLAKDRQEAPASSLMSAASKKMAASSSSQNRQANSAMPTSGESCGQRETCSPGIFGGQVSLKAGENRSSGINLRQTPLIHAAMAGILSEVQSLLTEKCDPDSQDDLGMTALMWTACSLYYPASWKQDHTGVASLLLKSKASIDLADINGVTALMHAVANTGLGASELTHRQQRHGRPTLYWERTCRATDVEDMIQLMINWRADIERCNKDGMTPLILVAAIGSIPSLKILLEARANLHCQDAHGQTALEWAEMEGRSHMAEVLTLALKHHPMCV